MVADLAADPSAFSVTLDSACNEIRSIWRLSKYNPLDF